MINSLARSRVCTTSATAGSTKSTQEVAIDKAVKLLDSPGVLFGGSAEKQAMRGALRKRDNMINLLPRRITSIFTLLLYRN